MENVIWVLTRVNHTVFWEKKPTVEDLIAEILTWHNSETEQYAERRAKRLLSCGETEFWLHTAYLNQAYAAKPKGN